MISTAEEPDDEAERLHQLCQRPRRGLRARCAQTQTQSASLATSDGCTLNGPSRNQRRAPLIGGAIDEHGNAERRGAREQDRSERAQPVVVEPGGEREQHEPGDRVSALLDEEGHRVAGAERRGRRCCAEDHHEPERDERQRHEDEQALLELTVSIHSWSFCTSLPNSSPRSS